MSSIERLKRNTHKQHKALRSSGRTQRYVENIDTFLGFAKQAYEAEDRDSKTGLLLAGAKAIYTANLSAVITEYAAKDAHNAVGEITHGYTSEPAGELVEHLGILVVQSVALSERTAHINKTTSTMIQDSSTIETTLPRTIVETQECLDDGQDNDALMRVIGNYFERFIGSL